MSKERGVNVKRAILMLALASASYAGDIKVKVIGFKQIPSTEVQAARTGCVNTGISVVCRSQNEREVPTLLKALTLLLPDGRVMVAACQNCLMPELWSTVNAETKGARITLKWAGLSGEKVAMKYEIVRIADPQESKKFLDAGPGVK
jgi:hypothetical protein